ncbi:hypothetical protein ColTof4_00141 [Colletotrichum tofieldiae]|nr:hypothetical protein ColTof3_07339 [Colletotrichum tofieldiae]GKT67718.1 hypothetical protein ColTof4_00141 [Colletotrichum tofieldiae]
MLIKTTIGYEFGSVRGSKGPGSIPVPPVGFLAHDDMGSGEWRIYRLQDDVMLIADVPCPRRTPPDAKGIWKKLIRRLHGIFLEQLGKVRVVYLLREEGEKSPDNRRENPTSTWVSNVNLVTEIML